MAERPRMSLLHLSLPGLFIRHCSSNDLEKPQARSLSVATPADCRGKNRLFCILCKFWAVKTLVGLRTQTQNAALFERKGPEREPWPRGKSLNRKKRSQCVF